MINNLSARLELHNAGTLYATQMQGKFGPMIDYRINTLMDWLGRNEVGGRDNIIRILSAHGYSMDYYGEAIAVVRQAVADMPGWH